MFHPHGYLYENVYRKIKNRNEEHMGDFSLPKKENLKIDNSCRSFCELHRQSEKSFL